MKITLTKNWFPRCLTKDGIREIHIVKNVNIDNDTIWRPTSESSDIVSFITRNKNLYIDIKENDSIFADEDSKGLFADFVDTTIIDGLELLDTSNVTTMEDMFKGAGRNVEDEFKICGLENWNVSKVKIMKGMFRTSGKYCRNSYDIGNLDNWDVSNVVDMFGMFAFAGEYAEYWNIGNIVSWNIKNCKAKGFMFSNSGAKETISCNGTVLRHRVKYEILSDEEKIINGHRLHRIRNIRTGECGGWVENEDNLSHEGNCWIEPDAAVFEYARVREHAIISGNARIFGNADVLGYAIVKDHGQVYGNAQVCGKSIIKGYSKVYDNACVGSFYITGVNERIFGTQER